MDSKPADHHFKAVTIDPNALDTPLGKKWQGVAKISEQRAAQNDYRPGKRYLHISGKYGDSCHLCSSLSTRYICCCTHVLRTMSNCPFDCSYCFLQNYLTNGTITAVADIPALIADVEKLSVAEPWRFLRVGIWELADSLALEPLLGNTRELIEAFATLPTAVLELRTKAATIDPILTADHQGKTIVSFSLNPESVIGADEHGTAALAARLEAMVKAQQAGYLLALHFDPMIYLPHFEEEYGHLIASIFAVIDPARVAWASLGVLRFNPEMRRTIQDNFPRSKLVSAEIVLGPDGKMRYVKPIRREMFQFVVNKIHQHAPRSTPFIYLCMENAAMWQDVFRKSPTSPQHLDYLLAHSLHRRFPHLVPQRPPKAKYLALDSLPLR